MKRFVSLLVIVCLAVSLLAGCNTPDNDDNGGTVIDASEYAESRDVTGRNIAYVTIKIKNYGSVKLLLDATTAPRTVANFLVLAKSGFYNGLTFYMAQSISNSDIVLGGALNKDGSGGSDETIFGEFEYNGHANDISHKRGTISMLHSNYDLDDASSPFFITNGDVSEALDGYYAAFGYVVEGLSVVDDIVEAGIEYTENSGLITANRQPVIESVTVDSDIDYSLIRDVYVAPALPSQISGLLPEGKEYKAASIPYASASVRRIYKADDSYVFQICKELDGRFADILLCVGADSKISGAISLELSDGAAELDGFLESLVGLDIDSLSANTELPSLLKSLALDALRTVKAINSDASASKYIYTRDTEGRETYTIEMKIKDYEEPIVILLDATTAPITVANFVSLVQKGFYDGLDFHRIIKGFMIQGGDDSHLPASEQATSIKGEFDSNGHKNDIKHLRGTISMARTSVKDSASCGFFICDADAPHLDGDYAAFGYVLSGMATVDAIADYAVVKTDSNGKLLYGYEHPLIEYIKIIENN